MPVFRIKKGQDNKKKITIGQQGILREDEFKEEKNELDDLIRKKNSIISEINSLKHESEGIISDARDQADRINEQSKVQKTEAENILSEAKEQAEKILVKAKEEAEKEKEKGYSEGFDQGYTKGAKEGNESAIKSIREEYQSILKESENVLNQVISKKQEIIKKADEEILRIVLKVARKVISGELRINKEIVYNNLKEALKRLTDRENVIIHINKKDLPIVESHRDEFFSEIRGLKNFKIVEENFLNPGDCIVETQFGFIDAVIDSQFEELERILLEEE
ncbi:MAG: hypothetical protein C0601_09725 [Candidatus Muiribacterium halophilum]|uniref:Flagellar assembly protein FliH/Type III secretion system HrpE domain-containing protein n=1 Tax=Muiribacterium halophilum TaxID=2053465 RepID=A0A2N5ZDK0_MUIH1|nr:MAG: hypothetical protein C0601_09725 [Candidatus Muirbacterium halophilum]